MAGAPGACGSDNSTNSLSLPPLSLSLSKACSLTFAPGCGYRINPPMMLRTKAFSPVRTGSARDFLPSTVATATEVSTIAVLYALIIGIVLYGGISLRKFYQMLVETAALSGAILVILGTALAMAWALTQTGFARDLARGGPAEIGAWIDGAMPTRGETVRGYVQGMHTHWLAARARESAGGPTGPALVNVETRFRYNPDVESLPAMVPAVIPLLLMLIPSMLTALSVVREKELGSIVNLYVTPVSRLEFLLGKHLPYVVLALLNFLLLTAIAVFLFGVPVRGSFPTLCAAAFLYVIAATTFGLVVSSFVRSQIAALFGTAVLTILPAVQFSGMIDPVSALEGVGRVIGELYPTTHFLTIARGTFSKGLDFHDLRASFVPLLVAVPVLLALATALVRKQER